ncbi:band 3 anion transport protein-like [Selaginella moellendorffii]|uniref:band 3 anion transport protein-like n=1 Tax=Selaginella moellendorffii TaxID=88036 RepID=UPI000D1C4088|nr:band 3 anion transport protein-like [Selaginella moellendorffii]|eukprot:XP_024529655.1 band 3 anion transport protein-like [Selaginella moellendorffii]
MATVAATEIETTEELGGTGAGNDIKLCKKVIYHTLASGKSGPLDPSAAAASREKIDVKRKPFVEQHCGSRGQLISILRLDSDHQHPADRSVCKKLKNFAFAYATQWTRGLDFRIIFASHLIFWTSLLPAIAFGSWLQVETHGSLGITEVLVSTCFCGLAVGILGTQPLMVVGVSVPSIIFMVAASRTAERLSLDFLPWLAWIGLWCALLLFFLATSGACRLTAHLTFFSWEILRLFVGFSLLWIGVTEIVRFFSAAHSLEASILSLWLATCTLVLAVVLSGAQSWRCLNGQARELIQNYGPALTFLVFTVLPLLPKFQHIQFERVDMPDFLCRTDNLTRLGTLVRLKSVPMWAILLAFIPGALLACMIFVDHNAGSVVLKHANGYVLPEKTPGSWDLFIIAVLVCSCSIFGIPFCYGLSAQSIAHKRALIFHVNVRDEEGQQKSKEVIKSQRISVMIVSMLCGIPFVPGIDLLLEKIPLGVIAGMFLEMAYSCLKELKAIKRLKVFFTVSDSRNRSSLCQRRIYCTTQMFCALVIFTTSRTPAALVYPIFVLLVIGFRHYALLSIFTACGLAALDSPLSSGGTILEYQESTKAEVQPSSALVRTKAVEIESSSSPQSRGSPSMLIMPSSRRLKERSRRRNKRKRQTTGSAARTEDDRDDGSREMNQVRSFSQQASSFDHSRAGQAAEFNKDSTRAFGRSKRRALNIELHSNLLYDHGWQNSLTLLHQDADLGDVHSVTQSPATYESPHRPSPASSQLNGHHNHQQSLECVKTNSDGGAGAGCGSNSSHSSSHSRKRKTVPLASAGFSTTENPCFMQDRDDSNLVPTTGRETVQQN